MANGDSFKCENGDVLYVGITHGYNFRLEPADNKGAYNVVFMNGGFRNGERFDVGKASSLNSAFDLADRFDRNLPD